MRRLYLFVLAALLAPLGTPTAAQDFPNRTVRIVVPYPAGGGPDILARALADRLSSSWGQAIVVENRPGAGSLLGVQEVLRSAPDGHTIFLTDCATMSVTPLLYNKLPFDPQADFLPVTHLVKFYQVILANLALPADNLSELVAHAKANPGKLSYGSYGVGSQAHLSGELLKHAAGLDIQHVPYKGADSLLGAIRGEVQLAFAGLVGTRATTEAKQLKALAIGGPKRAALLPNLATFAEQGYPSVDTQVNFGVFVRSGTPAPVVARISRDIVAVLKSDDYQQKYLNPVAFEPVGGTPAEFAAFLAQDRESRKEAARIAGLKPTN